jgi:hypothetical protein
LGNQHVQSVEQLLTQELNDTRLTAIGFSESPRQSVRREPFTVNRDSSPQKSGC